MNYRMILRILSRVSLSEGAFLLISACVALGYGEDVLLPYGVPIALLAALGLAMGALRPRTQTLYARDAFAAVALSWIYLSVFGALPFYLDGAIPSFIDCLFETVSGFTTTGATILPAIEPVPKGLLFWRCFTQWIGGMGVLVFLVAVIPLAGSRSMHLMRAESPGPAVGKLVPRARSSASIQYAIYLVLTAVHVVLLIAGGMPVFDSVTMAFSTAGTGGFGVRNGGMLAYHSAYAEIVTMVFMMLFGVNFTLYFIGLKKPAEALKSEELRWYIGIFALATLGIVLDILPDVSSLGEAVRLAAFQSASVITTTGMASVDYAGWPAFSQSILMLLLLIGACAGSTGGGFKVSRVVILVKSIRREIGRMIHPRQVSQIKFEKKTVDAELTHSVLVYLAVYILLVVGGMLLISLNEFDFTTSLTAVLAMLNNVGPGLGRIGPMENFSFFAGFSKSVFCMLMLLGRLEMFPMLMLLAPSTWRR